MKIDGKHYLTIWHNENEDNVCIIDQTKLPFEFIIKKLNTYQDGFVAIKDMLVRGAPLIGATAAYSIYLAAKENENFDYWKRCTGARIDLGHIPKSKMYENLL